MRKQNMVKKVNEIKNIATCISRRERITTRKLERTSRRIDPTAPFDVNTPKENRPRILRHRR